MQFLFYYRRIRRINIIFVEYTVKLLDVNTKMKRDLQIYSRYVTISSECDWHN